MHKQEHHTFVHGIIAIATLAVSLIFGYLFVYWWVYGEGSVALNPSVLRNQVIATQQANDVKSQLQALGYTFEEEEFFHLSNPNTTNYRADVLGGYEPTKVEEEPSEESYYFYDDDGNAIFFSVGEDGQVDPDTFVPLIQH